MEEKLYDTSLISIGMQLGQIEVSHFLSTAAWMLPFELVGEDVSQKGG